MKEFFNETIEPENNSNDLTPDQNKIYSQLVKRHSELNMEKIGISLSQYIRSKYESETNLTRSVNLWTVWKFSENDF